MALLLKRTLPGKSSSPTKKPETAPDSISGTSFSCSAAHAGCQSGRRPLPLLKKVSWIEYSVVMFLAKPASMVVKLFEKPTLAIPAWSSVNDSSHWLATSFVAQV